MIIVKWLIRITSYNVCYTKLLRKMVNESGAKSTDLQSPEAVEHLCGKCHTYAKDWETVASELWESKDHKKPRYENYKKGVLD